MSETGLCADGLAGAFAQLDRHASRRSGGLPTLSLLVGGPELAVRCWSEWSLRRRRRFAFRDAAPDVAVATEVQRLVAREELVTDALAILSRRTRDPASEIYRQWSLRTSTEKRLWLERLGLAGGPDDLDRLCCEILEQGAGIPGDPARVLKAVQLRLGWDALRLHGAICRLVPMGELPAILFRSSGEMSGIGEFAELANDLCALAAVAPCLALGLAVPEAQLDALMAQGPETRTRAMLREGLVRIGVDRAGELNPRIPAAAEHDEGSGELPDPARSAAERFLFEVLEAHARTAGLFSLNATLDFPFGGNRPAQVDLSCRDLKLAVEIDGYYHFLGPAAYRRDRRKDYELQSRGWLVLRFLAEDVGARQEEIMASIQSAIDTRKRAIHGGAP